ncbi:histidine phosphatase family protein [Oceanobacillus kapialis]|uniref:Histidine phosphatase family protein n=1 Tax=Oceanobacillus kapialis TaxID=481353 RepID=A0ABW5Q4A3_9BACI
MNKTIYIIRHCKAEGQAPEAPLTQEGFLQANELAEYFSDVKVDRIISSPFLRAIQTIKPFADNRDIEVELEPRLAERVLSSAKLPDWVEKLEATFYDMDLKYEGGESSDEARKRIVEVVEEIIAEDFGTAIIVAHGGIISLLLNYYDESFGFDQWKALSNPDIYQLTFSDDAVHINRTWKG